MAPEPPAQGASRARRAGRVRRLAGHWLRVAVTALAALVPVTVGAEPLRLHGVNYLGDLPTRIAEAEGMFAAEGLEVEVRYGGSGRDNLAALSNGDTDLALMAPAPFLLHRLARHPAAGSAQAPVILANLVHSEYLNHVVVAGDADIDSPQDLRGRRVGVMQGTNAAHLWWLYAISHGLDEGSVTLVDLPTPELPGALRRGRVDAAVLWEPWTHRLGRELPGGIRRLPGGYGYAAKWLLVARQGLVERRPQAVAALLRAYAAAVRLIDTDPERASRVQVAAYGSERPVLDRAQMAGTFELGLGWSLLGALHQGIAWARAIDAPGARQDTDVLAWIAAEPLRALDARAVGLPARPAGTPSP